MSTDFSSTTTRTWKCMRGSFEGQVTGDANLACWCHCNSCRRQTGAAMQLGVWVPDNFEVLAGRDDLIKFTKNNTGVYRNSCSKCARTIPGDDDEVGDDDEENPGDDNEEEGECECPEFAFVCRLFDPECPLFEF